MHFFIIYQRNFQYSFQLLYHQISFQQPMVFAPFSHFAHLNRTLIYVYVLTTCSLFTAPIVLSVLYVIRATRRATAPRGLTNPACKNGPADASRKAYINWIISPATREREREGDRAASRDNPLAGRLPAAVVVVVFDASSSRPVTRYSRLVICVFISIIRAKRLF